MKKRSLLFFLMLLLLAGCTAKQYERNMELGAKALKEEKYEEAITYFQKALKEKNTEEAQQALQLSKQIKQSHDALKKGKFETAIFIAEKVKRSKQKSTVVDIIKTKAEKIIEEAKTLDATLKDLEIKMVRGKMLLENRRYDEAMTVFTEIAKTKKSHEKIDQVVKEANEMIAQAKKEKTKYEQEKQQEKANQNETSSESENKNEQSKQTEKNQPLTHEEAEQLVRDYLNMDSASSNVFVKYDHDNEHGHYVFQVYELVIDNSETKEGHTATIGWYAVDPINKTVYDALGQ
jgi:tetratricopeptide (TPR) repeat protein